MHILSQGSASASFGGSHQVIGNIIRTFELEDNYLDDLLIVTKGSFQDNLEKLEQVLTRLAEAGLKVNVHTTLQQTPR